ncbi:MAG TPA: hypothetical protein DDZ51_07745 [Planctomycetaceae bacterium]|nr:hypothetical protein [Planctomycetaceae bacterium]
MITTRTQSHPSLHRPPAVVGRKNGDTEGSRLEISKPWLDCIVGFVVLKVRSFAVTLKRRID